MQSFALSFFSSQEFMGVNSNLLLDDRREKGCGGDWTAYFASICSLAISLYPFSVFNLHID
jgi:hypothetical protein